MKAIKIEGQTTRALMAPEGMEDSVYTLWTQPITTSQGYPSSASFWEPDYADLELLKEGGTVQLTVMGQSHPPVDVSVVPTLRHGDLRPHPTNDGPEQLRAQRDVLLETVTNFLHHLDTPGTDPSLSFVKQMRHVVSVSKQGGVSVDTTDLAMTKWLRERGIQSIQDLERVCCISDPDGGTS